MIELSTVFVLLLQVALILSVCRIMGTLAVKVHQPKVVGEMLAGIMLGPSLLGWLAPGLFEIVFPSGSVQFLNVLAQIGVILFLFLIGLELDPRLLRQRGHSTVLISHASIVVPFLLGAALTVYLYPLVFNDTPTMRFTSACLFMGAAMSVTAFPVLARILTERNLTKTNLGAVAIACAAIDDVSAWCMLAFVVAVGKAEGLVPGLITAALSAGYIALMVFVVRPQLQRLERLYERPDVSAQSVLAIVLVLVLISAAITELIGIHALFGAFLMGAIMPKGTVFVRMVTGRLEDLTVIFLLPLFFAYTGLRTQIGLLGSSELWLLTGLIIAVACLGKFGGSMLSAWATGMNLREASAIGILMNTRGLMELVILTIGLQIGVITDVVFAMMVMMALVTTAMTTPVLHLVYPVRLFETSPVDERTASVEFGILVPVSRPESGRGLASMASWLSVDSSPSKVYALTLMPLKAAETLAASTVEATTGFEGALSPLLTEAQRLGVPVERMAFPSRDIPSDIARVARSKRADLVLMGFHKPLIGNTILGGTVHRVVTGTDCDVAILVDRGLKADMRVLVPYLGSEHDRLALELAKRIANRPGMRLTVLRVTDGDHDQGDVDRLVRELPANCEVVKGSGHSPVDAVLARADEHDLVVIGLSEDWGLESHLFGLRAERIADEWKGSILLTRKYVSVDGM